MNVKQITLPFDVALPPVKNLRAGGLTCLYEDGRLRNVRCGEREILRMLYGALRDENWGTIVPSISDEQIDIRTDSFRISYTALYKTDSIHFKASYLLEGSSDNEISCSMQGVALNDFQKNRIGLCVHHPIDACAGRDVAITDPAGNIENATFPELISPHQPFRNIREMKMASESDINLQILFEGDIFETEDQRNWSDSSYKTYSTPLHLPFPVLIKAGEKLEQKITLRVSGNLHKAQTHSGSGLREEKILFPKIGYCRPEKQPPLASNEVALLKKIPFDCYRVELFLREANWKEVLVVAAAEASMLNTKLYIVAFTDDNFVDIENELLASLVPYQTLLDWLLLLPYGSDITSPKVLEAGYARLKEYFPDLEVGYGTNRNFAELNRNRPPQLQHDFISFSVNPQMHATDTRTLLENLENQHDMIKTARNFSSMPIHISPLTLKERIHAGATNATSRQDPRQHTAFAAFWTLVSIQNFADAQQIILYESTGENGLINQNKLSPVYQVLEIIKAFDPKWIVRRYDNENLLMDSVIIENAAAERIVFCQAPFQGAD